MVCNGHVHWWLQQQQQQHQQQQGLRSKRNPGLAHRVTKSLRVANGRRIAEACVCA
jgi:hypothetical protein